MKRFLRQYTVAFAPLLIVMVWAVFYRVLYPNPQGYTLGQWIGASVEAEALLQSKGYVSEVLLRLPYYATKIADGGVIALDAVALEDLRKADKSSVPVDTQQSLPARKRPRKNSFALTDLNLNVTHRTFLVYTLNSHVVSVLEYEPEHQ